MQTQIAFRHMDSSEAVTDHIHHKLQRFSRFGDIIVDVSVTISKTPRPKAEFVFKVKGDTLKCSEEADDLYAAIDRGLETAERVVIRYRDHLRAR